MESLNVHVILSQQGTGLELSMVNGHVVLKFAGTTFKSKAQYQDGEWHYVTARKQGTRYDEKLN